MQTKLDEAKAELLERAARVAENSPAGGHLPTGTTGEGRGTPDPDTTVLAFLQRYYLHTAPEDLTDRDPVDVFGAALSHYRLAENAPAGHGQRAGAHPDRRGERLDVQPLGRRGRHRRHALPRRLGHQ